MIHGIIIWLMFGFLTVFYLVYFKKGYLEKRDIPPMCACILLGPVTFLITIGCLIYANTIEDNRVLWKRKEKRK